MTPADWNTLHPPRLLNTPHLDRSARHLLGLREHRNLARMEATAAIATEVLASHDRGTMAGFMRWLRQ